MPGLITITAPGDVVGAVTAVANALAEGFKAIQAIANDQSPEGRTAARGINTVLAPLVGLAAKVDRLLGLHVDKEVGTTTAPVAPLVVSNPSS